MSKYFQRHAFLEETILQSTKENCLEVDRVTEALEQGDWNVVYSVSYTPCFKIYSREKFYSRVIKNVIVLYFRLKMSFVSSNYNGDRGVY